MKFKNLLSAITISSLLLSSITPVLANEININTELTNEITVLNKGNETAEPYAEKTGYKYTTINGVRYKRLWSYTRNCWIDPIWTPA